jgi:hypothetical protein
VTRERLSNGFSDTATGAGDDGLALIEGHGGEKG